MIAVPSFLTSFVGIGNRSVCLLPSYKKPLSEIHESPLPADDLRLYFDVLTPILEGIWIARALKDKAQAKFWAQKLVGQVQTFLAGREVNLAEVVRTLLILFATKTDTRADNDDINVIMELASLIPGSEKERGLM